jgi:hypothetical protein
MYALGWLATLDEGINTKMFQWSLTGRDCVKTQNIFYF